MSDIKCSHCNAPCRKHKYVTTGRTSYFYDDTELRTLRDENESLKDVRDGLWERIRTLGKMEKEYVAKIEAQQAELTALREENERLQNEAAKYKDWYNNMADEVIAQQTELAKQQKGGDDGQAEG